jgi:hypothetical protein
VDRVTFVVDRVTFVVDRVTFVVDRVTFVVNRVTFVVDRVTFVVDRVTFVVDRVTVVTVYRRVLHFSFVSIIPHQSNINSCYRLVKDISPLVTTVPDKHGLTQHNSNKKAIGFATDLYL